jgi:hypothetical protein
VHLDVTHILNGGHTFVTIGTKYLILQYPNTASEVDNRSSECSTKFEGLPLSPQNGTSTCSKSDEVRPKCNILVIF